MRTVSIALTTLAIGCAADVRPAPTPDQLAATSTALDVWEASFGDAPQCSDTADDLWWRVLPYEEAHRLCGKVDLDAEACFVVYPDGGVGIILQVTPYPRVRQQLQAHELAHWLQRCSGREPRGDREHADAAVWPAFVDATRERLRTDGDDAER